MYTWRDWGVDALMVVFSALLAVASLLLLMQSEVPPPKPYQPRSYCLLETTEDFVVFDLCTNVSGERRV